MDFGDVGRRMIEKITGIRIRYDLGDGHVAWVGDDQEELRDRLPRWYGAAVG
jgi:hypothetical protein